jgi:GPH family glycoside/pentoside/hexuronide:cation symporter
VVHGINLLFSFLPGVFALLAAFATIFYPLDEPQVKTIERDLAARKAGAVPAI